MIILTMKIRCAQQNIEHPGHRPLIMIQ